MKNEIVLENNNDIFLSSRIIGLMIGLGHKNVTNSGQQEALKEYRKIEACNQSESDYIDYQLILLNQDFDYLFPFPSYEQLIGMLLTSRDFGDVDTIINCIHSISYHKAGSTYSKKKDNAIQVVSNYIMQMMNIDIKPSEIMSLFTVSEIIYIFKRCEAIITFGLFAEQNEQNNVLFNRLIEELKKAVNENNFLIQHKIE